MKEGQFYFFACAGINITFHLINKLNNYEFQLGLQKIKSESELLKKFNQIYVKIFKNFHSHWMKYEKKHDVMQFNVVMMDFFKQKESEILN